MKSREFGLICCRLTSIWIVTGAIQFMVLLRWGTLSLHSRIYPLELLEQAVDLACPIVLAIILWLLAPKIADWMAVATANEEMPGDSQLGVILVACVGISIAATGLRLLLSALAVFLTDHPVNYAEPTPTAAMFQQILPAAAYTAVGIFCVLRAGAIARTVLKNAGRPLV